MSDEVKVTDGAAAKLRGIDVRLIALEAIVKALVKRLEKQFGIDINMDGKVGSVRASLLCALGLVSLLGVAALAGETIIANWVAPEGQDAVLKVQADEGDDTADVGELIMTTSGTLKVDLGGTTVGTFSSSGLSATTISAPTVTATTGYKVGAAAVSGINTNLAFVSLPGTNITLSIGGGIITNVTHNIP